MYTVLVRGIAWITNGMPSECACRDIWMRFFRSIGGLTYIVEECVVQVR